jgi:hypothetical protein
MHTSLPRSLSLLLAIALMVLGGCSQNRPEKIIVGSKFFTEQVVLAELLAEGDSGRRTGFVCGVHGNGSDGGAE